MQEAGRLLHEACVGKLASIPDLEALDALWVRWQSDRDPGRPDPNTVVNALGLCFGQQLVDRLGFRWAVITDQLGTEMGCIAGEVTVCPANLTAKRLEEGGASVLFGLLFPGRGSGAVAAPATTRLSDRHALA